MTTSRRDFLKGLLASTGVGVLLASGAVTVAEAIEKINATLEPSAAPVTYADMSALLKDVYVDAIREQLNSEAAAYTIFFETTPRAEERWRFGKAPWTLRSHPWEAYPPRKVRP